MNIHLEYMGFFKIDGVPSGSEVECVPGTTISAMLDRLRVKQQSREFMVPLVNRVRQPFDHPLQDGETVFLYFPVGGG
jgi:molybdopterin converting factor small subunit